MKIFAMGSELIARAAREVGAQGFFAYPITPASEIMVYWLKEKDKQPKLDFLQTEDEMSAGFSAIGYILAGKPAWTATAGPGNVLMQDAFSMAESMRVPLVAVIGQRGGPSTGTVVYSQQEVNLTAYGGNSEGWRVVYSPSGLGELYQYTKKSFQTAWRYRFPTFLLTDGYTTKLNAEVEIEKQKDKKLPLYPFFKTGGRSVNYRNCYEYEEDILKLNQDIKKDFEKARSKIEEWEFFQPRGAQKNALIIAHGIVALAAKEAVDAVGASLFRPITLRPFPGTVLRKIAPKFKKIFIFESADNQLLRLVKEELYGLSVPIAHYGRPGVAIETEEIIKIIKNAK